MTYKVSAADAHGDLQEIVVTNRERLADVIDYVSSRDWEVVECRPFDMVHFSGMLERFNGAVALHQLDNN